MWMLCFLHLESDILHWTALLQRPSSFCSYLLLQALMLGTPTNTPFTRFRLWHLVSGHLTLDPDTLLSRIYSFHTAFRLWRPTSGHPSVLILIPFGSQHSLPPPCPLCHPHPVQLFILQSGTLLVPSSPLAQILTALAPHNGLWIELLKEVKRMKGKVGERERERIQMLPINFYLSLCFHSVPLQPVLHTAATINF